jgi:hydrogenase nickel incorporation protein HypA/HybF
VHEFGLVSGIIDAVNKEATDAHATTVLDVYLEIGEMTEAVEEALQFAFEALSTGTLCEGAKLHVEMVAPRSRCLDCKYEFAHDRYHRVCPRCDSFATELIAGRELAITSIEVDIPEDELTDKQGI